MIRPKRESQVALFCEFSLEDHVPQGHLLRSIDRFVGLSSVRAHLSDFYSHTGRPSVDPELLIVGMTSRALMARNKPEKADIWTAKLLDQKPFRLATVAMANKSARIIWAILTKGEENRQPIA